MLLFFPSLPEEGLRCIRECASLLFHTYISPILLYSVENWATLTDKELKNMTSEILFTNTDRKIDILHRKMLKYILGASKSCQNTMIYGETSEIPISIKGYRLMVNYWHRVTNLPDQTLVKKALLENIYLRTNWIKTIEKLTNWYNIINLVDSPSRLKKASYNNSKSKFIEIWTNSLQNPEMPKLEFYRTQKNAFITEKYLDLPLFQHRQIITKLRCSDHQLDIERGRYRGILRIERIFVQTMLSKTKNTS